MLVANESEELELLSVICSLNGEGQCKSQRALAEDFYPGEEPTQNKQSQIRKVIRRLRKKINPILSLPGGGGGYFFPDKANPEKGRLEVLAWRDYMRQRIKSECIITNQVLKACSIYLNDDFRQLVLPF
ncbi:unnamed protein product [marine sediment metagenome]|uniref:Uncharacterized protein n=1 Tax=marine sediment metagenome TaxID=412755 RepID=X0W8I2_9ZZZZ